MDGKAATTTRDLVNRLNRIQGQLEALKRSLDKPDGSTCVENIRLLKAANNALKKFGEAYVTEHMRECLQVGVSEQELESNLKEVIHSAFSL